MIRNLGESVGSTVVETVGRVFGRAQEQRPLPADLFESEEEFLAVFDAPGAHAADIQVKYENDAIVVRVDRFRDFYDGFEMQFPGRGLALDGRIEFPPGASVDPDAASATLRDDGTLHVRVPKREPAEINASAEIGRETEVETESGDETEVGTENGGEIGETGTESDEADALEESTDQSDESDENA